ncbi:MAG: sugar phosphate isomerase/epimerase, partial [Hyphomicrobiales bacterium]|nr:sugar phosphate isomerase/epimerase [Hyphomicrobiales bacterium]
EEWTWVVDATKECFAHAKSRGVKIAVEPLNRFETYLFNRCAQALALAEAVDPECGVCLDAFHINIEESDIYEAIRLAGDRLFDFHVADNNRFAAGLGHLNWARIVGTLKEIGYDGALTNEFVAPVDRTPATMYPDMVEKNPVDISPEQLKFIEDHGSSLLSEEFYSDQMRITAETLLPLMK